MSAGRMSRGFPFFESPLAILLCKTALPLLAVENVYVNRTCVRGFSEIRNRAFAVLLYKFRLGALALWKECYMSTGFLPRFFSEKSGTEVSFSSLWNPATSYSPGPFPAKYHQR